MKKKSLVSQDDAHRRVGDALRLRVGMGKRYSFAGLSEATGIPERTLRSYVDGTVDTTPGLPNLLALFSVLGAGFASDVLGVCNLTVRDGNPDEAEHIRALSLMCSLSGDIAAAVDDGVVDHQERAQLQPAAEKVIAALEPIARPGNAVSLKRGDAA
ncbi:hypothetical protein [Tranquillimonas rosea]|uniref:hypothetical protein n=1 Tax=Tranquillimonas rosea TaxID=641238 RepID=UPI003BAC1F6A